MAGLYIQPKLRHCYIIGSNNKRTKGLFHCWNHINDGDISHTAAIIELADGIVTNIRPESIIFLDSPFQDYSWEEEDKEDPVLAILDPDRCEDRVFCPKCGTCMDNYEGQPDKCPNCGLMLDGWVSF